LQVYLLDARRQPVPLGVPGEIYVGGAGVARGYLNRPALTAERFIANPFASDGRRMYKSGDIGRWRPDGTLEYLGRNDDQVKIRGFRIELGEIQARLAQHAKVRDAVVLAREEQAGEKRLIAYVVASDPANLPTVDELRAHVRAQLPEYMVPSALVTLPGLPLTANGKLDRRALPAPGLAAYGTRAYEAPLGQIEEILAGIWQSILHVEQVGRHDNFFELGGHSLLIVQMMERLRRVGLSAQAKRIFESANLAELAGALTRQVTRPVEVPPNLIPAGCTAIAPEMVPLVDLTIEQLAHISSSVRGGAANIHDIYPLAPLQEGILFHHLLNESGGDTYVLPTIFKVSSAERVQQLIDALQFVIDRHDVLRTAVLWEHLPRPVQVVYRKARLPVTNIVLTAQDDPDVWVEQSLLAQRQRLDLRFAPLLKLQVAHVEGTTIWYVLLQMHHMTLDHLTTEFVTREVIAHLRGQRKFVGELAPYREHVARALVYAQTHEAEAFFRCKLSGVVEPSAPFGLLDVRGDGSHVVEAREVLEASLSQQIRARARSLAVSAATLFHAAWALVLAHTSGRQDVVFGTVLLGRMLMDGDGRHALGMFINTLPLRLQLQDLTVRELVERTQRELVELLSHEQASLAIAQRCSDIVGSAPLFTSLLNYRHSVPDPGVQWSNAEGLQVLASRERTNYPIALSVDDLGAEFSLTAQTDARIAPQRVAVFMREAMQSLLRSLDQAPDTAALELSILTAEERRRILGQFNDRRLTYPADRLIQQLFEEQVARTPEQRAIVYQQASLTFAELNRRANQLARHLRARGIGPDQRVGICLDRGLDMVIAVLGSLKAGGAYVPLDPSHPPQRLAYMLQNAAPRIVITSRELMDRLAVPSNAMVQVDDWTELADHPDANIEPRELGSSPADLAYVIYTSGSTGQPKGVMIEHRNVLNLWRGLEEVYASRGHLQNVALNASLNFDASVQQLVQLLSGRTLHIVPAETRRDPARLLGFLASQEIEAIDCTPSQLKSWIAAGLLEGAENHLCVVLVGGEAIDAQLWSNAAHSRAIDFYNVYGPTECTVDATVAHLNADSTSPHIGRPMANRSVYILGAGQQPVPVGVAGEIYIGGEGVGRGYLNLPDMTAERFVPDPHAAQPLARMYKTGDVGCWRADGTVEYLGRNDAQVKIRGFRIELGEIEAHLCRHASIKEAVVVVREDVPGDKRLVAYFAVGAGVAPEVESLRDYLRRLLPEYMVPSAFVALERLPLTISGKVDRQQLPLPELGAFAAREYQDPEGEVELSIADIWRELLRMERVGRDDNFFDLGGHSLLAMQAASRLQARHGVEMPIRLLFEHATVRQLAEQIESLRRAPRHPSLGTPADDVDELLAAVAAMPESRVQELLREMATEGRL
jgi:amino acid adenylation domain-containing protein